MPKKISSADKGQFKVSDYFALEDIFLWSTSFTRENDYIHFLHSEKCITQTMRGFSVDRIDAANDEGEGAYPMLRVLVTHGIRIVFGEVDDDDDYVVLHALESTFALDFHVVSDTAPSQTQFESFVQRNCEHISWPFWRQNVFDTFKRASLPVPVVPLLNGLTSSANATQSSSPKSAKKASKKTVRDVSGSRKLTVQK